MERVKWELRPCLFSSRLSLNPFVWFPLLCFACHGQTMWPPWNTLETPPERPPPWKGGLASQETKSGLVQGKGMFIRPPFPDQVVRSRGPRRGSGPGERHQGQGRSPQPASSLDKQASCAGCHVIHHNHKSKRQRMYGQSLNEA